MFETIINLCFFFSERFGLYYVNFSDPARPRKRKASVGYFKNILKTKKLPKNLKSSKKIT